MTATTDVTNVAESERARVLWLLLSDQDESARVEQISNWLEVAKDRPQMFRGLRQAQRNGRVVGATWAQALPGNVGVLWLPRLTLTEPAVTAQSLIQAAKEYWIAEDSRFVQAIVSDDAHNDEQVLQQSEFSLLTELDYMTCDLPAQDTLATRPETEELKIESYHPDQRPDLLALIEKTYVETLDCPEMDDARPLDEVVAGYQSTGRSGTQFWYMANDANGTVGCLLLADHENGDFELVYVGLAKSARGKKWGTVLTEFGKQIAGNHGGQRMLLAVDHRNLPAIEIYRRLGFSVLCRRRIWTWEYNPRGD